MKATLFAIFATLFAAGSSSAEIPKKPADYKYSTLWSNSPFTSKPPVKADEAAPSALDDWTLGGVSEVEGGYMITLLHKKNAGESMIIRPRGVQKFSADSVELLETGAPGTFKLDRVEYGKGGWKDISVHLLAGGKSGTVRFDEKNLAPKATAAPAQGNRQGQQPGAKPVPGKPNQNPTPPGVRQPRQRVLPPTPQR